MQAPDTLAEEYEIFEETMKKVTCCMPSSKREHGSRFQGVHNLLGERRLGGSTFAGRCTWRLALTKKACQRTTELKGKVTDAHEEARSSPRTVQKSNQ